MAATKKRTSSTTARKRKTSGAKDTKATLQAKKQMYAVVLFAAGLLLGALTLIEGEKLWKWLHDLLFGLFGWSVYFLAPLMIYIAVIAAMDRPLSAIKAKLWQLMALIVIISGAIQIHGPGLPDEASFAETVVALFEGGKLKSGGGLAGAIFAYPLLSLTGEIGAKIIIWLCIFVFVMLITGSSLISLYRYLKMPVENLEEAYLDAVETQKERRAAAEARKPEKAEKPAKERAAKDKANKFNIDVDISGDSNPGAVPAAAAGDVPEHESKMPGHPVTAQAAEPATPILPVDSPVEYITPEEFAPRSKAPIPVSAPEPVRTHPLDDEILRAESKAVETSELEDIIGRVFAAEQEPPVPPQPFGFSGIGPELAPAVEPPLTFADAPPTQAPAAEPLPFTVEDIPSIELDPPLLPQIYRHPPLELLSLAKAANSGDISEELKNNAQTLVDTLKSFGVQTRITDICRGPAVTRYELQPSAGVKISKITGLSDDIALNLASAGIRIEAPIPNKAAVGIEVPNKIVSTVSIREIIDSPDFDRAESSLSVALGKDIAGNTVLADLGKMPHVLIAGSTGSGKSVCINSIIVSLLYKSSPDEVKLLMVDPKVVELGIYNGIPHLLVPVVTDPKKAAGALSWAVSEMLNRYKTFADNSVRDLAGYNRLAEQSAELQPMPKIVIIIDELADLMMAAPGDVEDAICRLAQMARAAGMHLVIATQRPSVDVITGVIKANIPSRIAFAVSSQVDSRTILDMGGAEKLLGRGDMLFYPVGAAKPTRVQGCFVTDTEVEQVVEFVKQGDVVDYDQTIVEEINNHVVAEKGKKGGASGAESGGEEDEMLPQAIECVVEAGQASTSLLQRRLKLGYARAARIVDQLEQKGIVGPFEGSKPRAVLISKDRWMEMKLSGAEDNLLRRSGDEPQPADSAPFAF